MPLCYYISLEITMSAHEIKEVQLQTLINIILRDLGLRHKAVEYEYIAKLDTVCAISNGKHVTVRFGDNLDTIEHIMVTAERDVIYEKYNVQFADVLCNKNIKHAIMVYDYDL